MVFYFWIRKHIRRVMKPIDVKTAERYSNVLTTIYFFTAMSCFGFLVLKYVKRREALREKDLAYDMKNPGFFYGKIFRAPNMHIYRLEGGQLIKDGVYKAEEDLPEKVSVEEFYGDE